MYFKPDADISPEAGQPPTNRSLTWKLAASGAVLVAVLVTFYFRLRPDSAESTSLSRGGNRETPLEQARDTLRRAADLGACRAALQQINVYLSHHADRRPPALEPARRAELQRQLALEPGELDELERGNFSPLDSQHLELCFLLRDAALSLETRSQSDRTLPAQEEAAAAFGWVVRQVRLSDTRPDADPGQELLAPQFVLRRGHGSPLARALLFLGMVEQLGHDACLLAIPGGPGKPPRYWACGVLGSKDQVYLFDPRLGVPLPGPGGKGIATLAEVRRKDSPVLAQLRFDGEQSYDVTPEQAAASEVHLAPSLSALAPRMRFLEKELLGPTVRVRLAADPKATERFARALRASGHNAEVRLAPWAARLARRFFPEEEGGIDRTERKKNALQPLLAPSFIRLHFALPTPVRPRRDQAGRLDGWSDPPLDRLAHILQNLVIDFAMAPGQPRDLVLRGQYLEAARALGPAQDQLEAQKRQFETQYNPEDILRWYEAASAAHARGDQAQLQAVWKKFDKQLAALVLGSSAEPRLAQVSYLRALSKQEGAERLQFRLDHFPAEVEERDLSRAEELWKETLGLWQTCLNHSAGFASESWFLFAARLEQARCQQMLAAVAGRRAAVTPAGERARLERAAQEGRQRAVELWRDLAQGRKDLQALACLLQARLLQGK